MAQITLNSSGVASNGTLALQSNGTTTAVTIDASQNVGLGVTPSAWFSGTKAVQLLGATFTSTASTGYLYQNSYLDTNTVEKYYANGFASKATLSSGGHQWFTAASGTAGNTISFTQAMTLDASGNLGVGITTPVSPLTAARGNVTGAGQWASSAIAVYNPTNTGSYSQISFGYTIGTTNAAAYIGYVSTNQGTNGYGDLVFGTRAVNTDTQPTERARIDSSGNLLVGTTSKVYEGKISVSFNGNGGSGAQGIALIDTNASLNGDYAIFINSSGNVAGKITHNGTTTVAYTTTSDYRLKTVIGPVANAGQRIDALQPIEYTWNASGERTRGFLAHQFQEVYAGSVSGTKDAVDAEGKPVYQSMQASSSEVIADLVAEIKSLRQRLAAAGI